MTTDERDRRVRPEMDRLLLDVMLGKLAVYLRTCGYDTAYAGDRGLEADARIREVAASEGRLLLTRDRQLAAAADDVLAELDLVVASPHSALDGDGTDRLIAAIEHPAVDVIGHPTGRMLNRRPGHDIDVERVAEAAAAHGTALEVNANPNRLDLRSGSVKVALETGATVSVNTDAHRPGAFEYVRYGVHTARRGWCEPEDVLNCRDADGVRQFLES